MSERIETPCPADGCDGAIKVPANARPGVYRCICHARKLRLSWITMANMARQPALYVAEPTEDVEP